MKRMMNFELVFIKEEDLLEDHSQKEINDEGIIPSKIYTVKDKITGFYPVDEFGESWTNDITKARDFFGEYYFDEFLECVKDDIIQDPQYLMDIIPNLSSGNLLYKNGWETVKFIFKAELDDEGNVWNKKGKKMLEIIGKNWPENIIAQNSNLLIYSNGEISSWNPNVEDLHKREWFNLEIIEIV